MGNIIKRKLQQSGSVVTRIVAVVSRTRRGKYRRIRRKSHKYYNNRFDKYSLRNVFYEIKVALTI